MLLTGAEAVESDKRSRNEIFICACCSMNGAAFFILLIPLITDHVDGQAKVCYFGPLPDPIPNTPDSQHWMKKILPEIRQRCQGKAFMLCVGQGDAITAKVKCWNPEPLGLADGSIPDKGIRASSHQEPYYASNARLNQNSYWQPSSPGYFDCWIEVDLVKCTLVSGVITQGSGTGYNWRVLKYIIGYQTLPSNSSVYNYVTDGDGNIQEFNGNRHNATTPVTNFFHNGIIATVVRLEPTSWANGIALRLELLGCDLE